MSTDHPPDAALRDYLNGKVPSHEAEPIEAHLDGCEACAARLESLSAAVDTFRERVRDAALTITAGGAEPPSGDLAFGGDQGDPVIGTLIAGRYIMLGVLGEGGMGTVYLAEQTQPVRRQVALKLIKLGMDSRTVLARFDAERQALALMDHPHIARVFDGGLTEARQPFFVMEYVRGVPITDYCDTHRLTVDARLELFVAVCQAVQHAHQKGIIHRDLKPGNVLVTEVDGRPIPKVIDFGVAKATEFALTDQSLGDTGAIVGTPTYMSPEQADPSAMDIDTRTDIYALGVILYELLAGSPPLDASQFQRGAVVEMLRMVREVDPARPSTKVSTADGLPSIAANRGVDPAHLKRDLRGDLDWIVMKALEKDRTRRYETAVEFAADVQRHLASEPVLAAPPSRSYRLQKFVRKHRAGVLAASLVVLALLGGIAGTTLGLYHAQRAAVSERRATLDAQSKKALAEANERKAVAAAEGERLAKQAALAAAEEEKKAKETAEAVLGFVEGKVFAAARPEGQDGGLGYEVKLADAIAAALPAMEQDFAGKPLVEARLRRTIALSFQYLGKHELAVNQFTTALSINTKHLGRDHSETLQCLVGLAYNYIELHQPTEALKLQEEALALQKARFGPDDRATLLTMNNLANSYHDLRRDAESLKLREETLARRTATLGADHPDTIMSMNNLPFSYTRVGRHAEALKMREEALAKFQARLGVDHPQTLSAMSNLAYSLSNAGRHLEALKLREEALVLMKSKLGIDHPATLYNLEFLPFCYSNLGRQADALDLRNKVIELETVKFGPDDVRTLMMKRVQAGSLQDLGRHAEALQLREEVLARYRVKLASDHTDTLRCMDEVASSDTALGRHDEAAKLRRECLALRRAKLGAEHPETLALMQQLADSCTASGQHGEALKLREEVFAIQQAKFGPSSAETFVHLRNLTNALIAAGGTDEALPLLEKYATTHPKELYLPLKIAALRAWLGQDAEYAEARRRALAAAQGTGNWQVAENAAKLSSIQPSSDRAELDAALALARMGAKVGDEVSNRSFRLLTLGMAAYRSGDETLCDEALTAATSAEKDNPLISGIAAFYRALSLYRRGQVAEARQLATAAAATMRPLPSDEKNPLAGNMGHDQLILWLAYKEAKALIGFDAPTAGTAPAAK